MLVLHSVLIYNSLIAFQSRASGTSIVQNIWAPNCFVGSTSPGPSVITIALHLVPFNNGVTPVKIKVE